MLFSRFYKNFFNPIIKLFYKREESNIDKLKLPCCPFCGVGLGYIEAFVVKNQCLHRCANCSNLSEVYLRDGTYKLFGLVQIISVMLLVVSMLLGGVFALLGLVLNVITLCVFYALTPYAFDLDAPKTVPVKKKTSWYHGFFYGKESKKAEDVPDVSKGVSKPREPDKVRPISPPGAPETHLEQEKSAPNKDPTDDNRDLFSD